MTRALLTMALLLAPAGLVDGQSRYDSSRRDRSRRDSREVRETPEPGSEPATASSQAAGGLDRYRLVVTRNIFLRDRGSGSFRRAESSSMPSVPRRGEDELVLRGVGVQEDGRVAFLEDTRSGQVLRVAAGQSIGPGTVLSVSLDGLQLQAGEAVRTIAIGESLSGRAAASAPASMGSASSAPAASQTRPADSGGLSDIEVRMRLRRQQENR